MTLAGRSSRQSSGRRWLILGVVVTLLVLLVDASIKSRDPGPGRQLAAQAWYDATIGIIGQSDVEGAELAAFRGASAPGLTADGVSSSLDAIVGGTRTTYQAYQRLREPPLVQSSAGLLQTCLMVRSEAAATIASTVRSALNGTGTPTTAAARTWATATRQLQVADQAYVLFAQSLPSSLGVRAPASSWVSDTRPYDARALQVFLDALVSRVSLRPVHRVALVSVGTMPTPIRTAGPASTVEVLAPSAALEVTAVVGNLGNQTENGLTVTATLAPAAGRPSTTATLDLAAGAIRTVQLSALTPPLGPTVTLTVTVTPPPGSVTRAATTVIHFEMPAPTSATTTTTTLRRAAATSTTVLGQSGSATPSNATLTTPGT